MKYLFIVLVLVLSMASSAFTAEDIQSVQLFTSYTGASATARYSAVKNTGLHTKKSIVIAGMHSAAIYAPYSGTVALSGAPTSTGPWVTLKDTSGNAVSATGNAVFDIDSLTQFVRATWTRSKHRVSVWMYYAK